MSAVKFILLAVGVIVVEIKKFGKVCSVIGGVTDRKMLVVAGYVALVC